MRLTELKKEFEQEILNEFSNTLFCPKCRQVLSGKHKKSNCFKALIKQKVNAKVKNWKTERKNGK